MVAARVVIVIAAWPRDGVRAGFAERWLRSAQNVLKRVADARSVLHKLDG